MFHTLQYQTWFIISVFLVLTTCISVDGYERFDGCCCSVIREIYSGPHYSKGFQPEDRESMFSEIFVPDAKIHGVTSLMTVILLLTSAQEIEVISQNSKISNSVIFIRMQRDE